MQPWGSGVCCLLCYRCVFSIFSNPGTHNTIPFYPNKLNRKLIFEEANIFRFPLPGTFRLVFSMTVTQSGTRRMFSTQDFTSGLS